LKTLRAALFCHRRAQNQIPKKPLGLVRDTIPAEINMESDESGAKKLSQIHLSPAGRFPNGSWISTQEPGIFN
jgi:hypothetical protein